MDIETRINELRGVLSDCLYKDRIRIEGELRKILSRSGRGTRVDVRLLERFLRDARRSVSARDLRGASLPALSYPEALPIIARKDEIVRAIHEHAVLVIAGETGSGKTTQIPKMCLEAGLGVHGRIGCTQPRRVAALSITRRIAEELGVRYGKEIGCKIRFADHTAPEAYIKIMTDGMLLAETQGDPLLSEYEVLIIDEAHERSLNIDFLLGYLKLLRRKRPELKIIITSATIDTEAFSRAFDNAPIIEVSGRLYPVETQHAPLDEFFEEAGEVTYIDAAVEAVSLILGDDAPEAGDILIFMPGERDILETRDRLEDEFRGRAEVIPLFARLSSREQHRIFGASPRRKIIVSTNIAETSLTIPGIRYVIDTGLARMSRYSPRTRTRRLPIEPISQSSANQRAGRCGRLANGVCIRLYSEDDFLERPRFTQPEIQRSNLAEVILRMKAFHLGEIETFPFLNPPQPQAIRAGYNLLEELGAMDEKRELTRLGLELARLPVDPAIGRIILQARTENALAEVLVIAAGLSIQDPRERPLEQRAAADTAHMRFRSEASDFLALLNIWNEFHDTWDRLKTQNQLRKFCKSNFLSYIRMREWNDTYNQLRQSLKECGRFRLNNEPASYAAIHRSILTGLIGHAAQKTSLNFYKGTMDRKFMVFPGSALFKKGLPKKKASGGDAPEAATHGGQPEWIVAGEILETSRVFAHTVAGIKPDWIAELGAHLCKSSYRDPYWDRKKGRVLVTEMINFRGLRVTERKVDYGRVSPEHATEVFIQSALVEERLPVAYGFIEHNREVRNRIEAWRTRLRSYDVLDPDAALFDFYKARLQSVSSLADLNRVIKQHARSGSGFLHVSEADLIGDTDLSFDHKAFPAYMMLGNTRVDIHYAFAPGEEEDGVTVRLPVELLPSVQPGMLDRIVPGLVEPKIDAYLRGLPKSHRRELVPVHEAAHAAAAELLHGEASLKESLRRW
ncbi:MAG: ATP-dependent RNA helicase HrpA, partial [Verrucomicrobia bacterium]|nr:ATP-dependent RNA helicase HrpA [Verrucomicrobiota bacterium]